MARTELISSLYLNYHDLAEMQQMCSAPYSLCIHNPEHAHILSGILKCPCWGKGMYGNIAKAGRKDKKTRYYYYCKNTVNATGHKCTFRCNIEQSQIDDEVSGEEREGDSGGFGAFWNGVST